MNTLRIEWTDHRGKVWHLTEGTEGVILDLDQGGLGWAEVEHVFLRGDMVWAAARVKRAVHDLKIQIGYSPVTGWYTGNALYQLIDEWWGKANSPFELGTLTVIRPDGMTRSRRLRLADTPDTTYRYDPGIGEEPEVELWSLTGDGGWWDGPSQTYTFSVEDLNQGQAVPFFGPEGHGWPLYISSGVSAGDAFVRNEGQGPAWIRWTLEGPLLNPRFGVRGVGVLGFSGIVDEGQIIDISTDPNNRWVLDSGFNESMYAKVSGVWAPVPVGDRVQLTLEADQIGEGARIHAELVEQFARAF